jgi:hypothetical protein
MRTQLSHMAAVVAAIAICQAAFAAEAPLWQQQNRYMRFGNPSGYAGIPALSMQVVQEDANSWPRLIKQSLQHERAAGNWPNMNVDLGRIIGGAGTPGAAAISGDWTHAQLTYGPPDAPAVEVWVSRLSPAVAVRTRAAQLTFFADRRGAGGGARGGGGGRGAGDGAGAAAPRLFAMPAGDSVTVRSAEELSRAAVDARSGDWLLCWFDGGSGIRTSRFPFVSGGRGGSVPPAVEADCPVLLVFSSPPQGFSADDRGLTVRFAPGAAGPHAVAILNIDGDLLPLAASMGQWRSALPPDIAAICRWWAQRLKQFPYSATENYAYDAAADQTTITQNIRYLPLGEGGTRFAPLPPMVSLALASGMPLKLTAGGRDATVTHSSAALYHGRYAGIDGVDQYSIHLSGLGALVRQDESPGRGAGEDAELVSELGRQVSLMLEAGHLAPWYDARNCYGAGYLCYWRHAESFVWSNPGETLYTLARALPFLPEDLAARTIAYMRKERTDYPPESVAHTPILEGARREWHRMADEGIYRMHIQELPKRNPYLQSGTIPEESIYYLAEYYRAAEGGKVDAAVLAAARRILEPYLQRQDWAILGFWPFRVSWMSSTADGWGGTNDINQHMAALIGHLRLARMAGSESPETWGLLARAAICRYAMGKYTHYVNSEKFYETPAEPDWMARLFEGSWVGQLVTYNWRGPLDDVRQVCVLNPYGIQFSDCALPQFYTFSVMPFLGAVPEVGAFARQYLREELKSFSDRYELAQPAWFAAKTTTNINAEFNYTAPEEALQVFQIRAWVLQEPGQKLESYLDTPWMARGDLYYIQKIVETIRAYRR